MKKLFSSLLFVFCSSFLFAQVDKSDTFFLVKKKGILRKLSESIYRPYEIESDVIAPVKIINPFDAFAGKKIRFISIAKTGFYTIVHDTVNGKKNNIGENLADFFHKNTLPSVVRKNLFFKEGDIILAQEISDNEIYLRSLPFFRDARIVLEEDSACNCVDVVILTRDVFSLGFSARISGTKRATSSLREENIAGTGNRLELLHYYDKDRDNESAFGANFTQRNLKGSFINWTTGFSNFNAAFNSGRRQETTIYTYFDKPYINRNSRSTGSAVVSFNKNSNQYFEIDSTYRQQFKYTSITTDFWLGFNLKAKLHKPSKVKNPFTHFFSGRAFFNNFIERPSLFKNVFNPAYVNLTGTLFSYNFFKQQFYRTKYIYGFGRSEDLPEGINASVIAGYVSKNGLRRGYYGTDIEATKFWKAKQYSDIRFRLGAFRGYDSWEDVDLLATFSHFTDLYNLGGRWRNRNFISLAFARQANLVLNTPLILQSGLAQPYYNTPAFGADARSTLKFESVFFNLKKFLGFRFAPFVFSDFTLLKPIGLPTNQSKGFTALGGGLRTRNENLVFGTIEVKGYYLPNVAQGFKNWRVEFGTNISFRYSNYFVRRPDFVSPN
jgi:hypothetical protein